MPQFGFVPHKNDPANPTTRLRFIEVARALQGLGVSAELALGDGARRDAFAEGCDLLVWGRRDWNTDVDWLRRRHGRVLLDFTDNLLTYPYPAGGAAGPLRRAGWRLRDRDRIRRFIDRFDAVLVGSRWLAARVAEVYPGPVHVIEDGQPAIRAPRPPQRGIDAVWVGMNNNIEYLFDIFGRDPAFADVSIRTVTAPRKSKPYLGTRSNETLTSRLAFNAHFIEWRPNDHAAALAECRVGLAPLPRNDLTMAKTENKLLLYSALGIPFLCSDIPAYRDYVERHGLGRICHDREDWLEGLHEFTESSPEYESIVRRGPEVVARHYGMDLTARKYLALYDDLMGVRRRHAG